jgi:hypothetical protein
LSRIRSPVTPRSNWANDSSMLSVRRPMLEVVLKDWVTETKDACLASNFSTSLAKCASRDGSPFEPDHRPTGGRDEKAQSTIIRTLAPDGHSELRENLSHQFAIHEGGRKSRPGGSTHFGRDGGHWFRPRGQPVEMASEANWLRKNFVRQSTGVR